MNEDPQPEEPLHICELRDLGALHVPDPEFGDLKLNVFPIVHDGTPVVLPRGFERWEPTVNRMLSHVPCQSARHFYVTIDSRFFPQDEALRREGVHCDGNFCADPSFTPRSTWGPSKPGWHGMVCISPVAKPDNSHVRMGWKLPYTLIIPVGKYVSNTRGGILTASSLAGCDAWPGIYSGEVESGGDFRNMIDQLGKPEALQAHRLYFMTSNTPHASLVTPAGSRRTLIRITFDCNYDNTVMAE